MKKLVLFMVIMAGLFGIQFLANCSSPLDTTDGLGDGQPQPGTEDTVFIVDTVVVEDTIINVDTIFVFDSTTITDTVIVIDTVFDTDTVIVIDSTNIVDTIIVTDTIISADTVFVTDTLTITDTLIVIDTVIQTDTVTIIDTTTIVDTIVIFDTLTIQDTVIVIVPDSGGPFMFCSRLGSNQQEVVWMFRNSAGPYRLEISAHAERLQPEPNMVVNVDGVTYDWNLAESSELILDQPLSENATVIIERGKPNPFGHAIDFCILIIRQDE